MPIAFWPVANVNNQHFIIAEVFWVAAMGRRTESVPVCFAPIVVHLFVHGTTDPGVPGHTS